MNNRVKPLTDVSVVSLALNLPGPLAVARLRDMGAAVLKVEPPRGDPLERALGDWYNELHEGIEIIRLDLKDERGRLELRQRLAGADLLITASRRPALARLGLEWQQLSADFPQLCQVAIVGHPAAGDDRPGHDLNFQAESGLLSPPQMPKSPVADLGGALDVVISALALVVNRIRDQVEDAEHRYCEVSLGSAAGYFAQPARRGLTQPTGALGGRLPQYHLYAAKQGWIAVAALEAHFWEALRHALGLAGPDRSALERVFRERTAQEWERWAAERDLPISAVR